MLGCDILSIKTQNKKVFFLPFLHHFFHGAPSPMKSKNIFKREERRGEREREYFTFDDGNLARSEQRNSFCIALLKASGYKIYPFTCFNMLLTVCYLQSYVLIL